MISQPRRKGKGKGKYVPLTSDTGQGAMSGLVPGRMECGCNATKHALVTNCLRCGRIVCTQEGVGECFTCGTFVCTPEQAEVLARGSRKSEQLKRQLERQAADGLAKAKARKDRLLEYQRTSAKRMAVIDDEADYFSHDSNKWLSEAERAKVKSRETDLRAKKEAARKANMIQIDFAGRNVTVREYDATQDLEEMYAPDPADAITAIDPKLAEIEAAKDALAKAEAFAAVANNPFLNQPRPEFVGTAGAGGGRGGGDGGGKVQAGPDEARAQSRTRSRLQDSGLSEMVDQGVCLSMHQPWASLLVRGIKQHEGRSWYSAHRGRLWIAATAKECDEEDVAELKAFYAEHHPGAVNFPKEYPSACLLGCVEVVDVQPQDDYREAHSDGESHSPFVFVCSEPEELVVRFPIKGKHKLWKLDKAVHDAARAGVQPANPGSVRPTARIVD